MLKDDRDTRTTGLGIKEPPMASIIKRQRCLLWCDCPGLQRMCSHKAVVASRMMSVNYKDSMLDVCKKDFRMPGSNDGLGVTTGGGRRQGGMGWGLQIAG